MFANVLVTYQIFDWPNICKYGGYLANIHLPNIYLYGGYLANFSLAKYFQIWLLPIKYLFGQIFENMMMITWHPTRALLTARWRLALSSDCTFPSTIISKLICISVIIINVKSQQFFF